MVSMPGIAWISILPRKMPSVNGLCWFMSMAVVLFKATRAGSLTSDTILRDTGCLSISINYRLAPHYQWPSGAEDLASVVQWLAANAEAYGGDGSRIVLMGH